MNNKDISVKILRNFKLSYLFPCQSISQIKIHTRIQGNSSELNARVFNLKRVLAIFSIIGRQGINYNVNDLSCFLEHRKVLDSTKTKKRCCCCCYQEIIRLYYNVIIKILIL